MVAPTPKAGDLPPIPGAALPGVTCVGIFCFLSVMSTAKRASSSSLRSRSAAFADERRTVKEEEMKEVRDTCHSPRLPRS